MEKGCEYIDKCKIYKGASRILFSSMVSCESATKKEIYKNCEAHNLYATIEEMEARAENMNRDLDAGMKSLPIISIDSIKKNVEKKASGSEALGKLLYDEDKK